MEEDRFLHREVSCKRAAIVLLIASAGCFGQVFNNNNGNDDQADRDRARTAAVSAAKGQVQRAQTLLNVALQRVQANWKANPQYLAAVQERQDAAKAFGAARDKVRDSLKGNHEFAEANDSVADATDDVHAEQQKTNATQPSAAPGTANPPAASASQIAAAQERLDSKTRLRKIEDDVVAADPDASKAKARLDKADSDLQVLQLQLKAALLNDPDYKSSLDQLTSAKAQLAQAAGSN